MFPVKHQHMIKECNSNSNFSQNRTTIKFITYKIQKDPTPNNIKKSIKEKDAQNNLKEIQRNDYTTLINKNKSDKNKIRIPLSVIRDIPSAQKSTSKLTLTENKKEIKKRKGFRRKKKYNCGRWRQEEQEKFIESIIQYGNEWKAVQKFVGTRSRFQIKSHAQKFFMKMKQMNFLSFDFDFGKNSAKTLDQMTDNTNAKDYVKAIKEFNSILFEKNENKKESNELSSNEMSLKTNNQSNTSQSFNCEINLKSLTSIGKEEMTGKIGSNYCIDKTNQEVIYQNYIDNFDYSFQPYVKEDLNEDMLEDMIFHSSGCEMLDLPTFTYEFFA